MARLPLLRTRFNRLLARHPQRAPANVGRPGAGQLFTQGENSMQGSLPRNIGRLTADLLRHPRYISRCLRHHPLNGRSPLEFEIPWFSYAAIDFLKGFLHSQMVGFEYGSGGSTLFL